MCNGIRFIVCPRSYLESIEDDPIFENSSSNFDHIFFESSIICLRIWSKSSQFAEKNGSFQKWSRRVTGTRWHLHPHPPSVLSPPVFVQFTLIVVSDDDEAIFSICFDFCFRGKIFFRFYFSLQEKELFRLCCQICNWIVRLGMTLVLYFLFSPRNVQFAILGTWHDLPFT